MTNEGKIIKTIYDNYGTILNLEGELTSEMIKNDISIIEKVNEYKGHMYDGLQMKEINTGLNEGIDVSLYAFPGISHMSMSLLRNAIKSGADVREIVNPEKKFNEKQTALLCAAAVSDLYDVEKIAFPHLDADRMLTRITQEYIRGDMPDALVTMDDLRTFGYLKDDVLPLTKAAAILFYKKHIPVVLINSDNTWKACVSGAELENHDGIYGIKKTVWSRHLEIFDRKHFMDLKKSAKTVKDGGTYYAIFQITQEADDQLNILFRGKEDIDKRGIDVEFGNYELVYAEKTEKLPSLDDIFIRFNSEPRIDGFYGHSLSVSDVIVTVDKQVAKAFYVDRVGYEKVSEFARQFVAANLPDGHVEDETEKNLETDKKAENTETEKNEKNIKEKKESKGGRRKWK